MRYDWRRSLLALEDVCPQVSQPEVSGFASGLPQVWAGGLDEVRGVPVVVVLGERGTGKSCALEQEHARLEQAGVPTVFVHLGRDVFDASSAKRILDQALQSLDDAGDGSERFVLLDGLDEGLTDVPGLDKVLASCIRGLSRRERGRVRVRITCRTTRWPRLVEAALRQAWEAKPDVALVTLAPLSRDEIRLAADCEGIDGTQFVEVLVGRDLETLAQQPVTLAPLLRAQKCGEELPTTAAEAYQQACRTLCAESWDEKLPARGERSSAEDLVVIAGWVAAALQFGRHTALVDRVPTGSGDLSLESLSRPGVPGRSASPLCGLRQLYELTESALLTPVGVRRWVFAHRSYQEFLAAEFLKACGMHPLVLDELLWAGDGETRHLLPEHEEVAARLAVDDDRLFRELVQHDPRVLLLADLHAVSPQKRASVAQALLDGALEIDDRIDWTRLAGLSQPDLGIQLEPFLTPHAHPDQRYLALAIAATCRPAGINPALLTVAEDLAAPTAVRSFALDGLADVRDQDAPRLLQLAADSSANVAEAALRHLWPKHLSLTAYLDLVPIRDWHSRYTLKQVTERIKPINVAEAVEWSIKALKTQDQAVLGSAVLAACIETVIAGDEPDTAELVQEIGEAIVALTNRHNLLYTHDADDAFRLLEAALQQASPPMRRRWGGEVLRHGAQQAVLPFLFETPGRALFPAEDLAHWAASWPELPDAARRTAQPLFSHRPRPEDPELRTVLEQARSIDPELRNSTAWWDAPEPEWQKRHRVRVERERRRHTYDELAFVAALQTLESAEPATVRQAWRAVIGHLYRTSDGGRTDQHALLSAIEVAPSCPPSDSELYLRLHAAALRVLTTAPVVTVDDFDAGHSVLATPELIALAFVTVDDAATAVDSEDRSRWAGWAVALAVATAIPSTERKLQSTLIRACAHRAGPAMQALLEACLDRLQSYTLGALARVLADANLAASLKVVRRWALTPGRDVDCWANVFQALVDSGDAEARHDLEAESKRGPDGGPEQPERWLRATHIIISNGGISGVWPTVRRHLNVPGLAQELIYRSVSYRSLVRDWIEELSKLEANDLADLYGHVCALDELAQPRPEHEPGVPYSITRSENLHDLADALPRLIAEHGTEQAANELSRLAELSTSHRPNLLRRLARRAAREAARRQHGPLTADHLGQLAEDRNRRVVADEIQLLDVVMEALDNVQEALSGPNGLAVLLWNRDASAPAAASWWPTWEEDFSDFVMGLLKIHLQPKRIILNREVQVHRPGIAGGGRTDIHIQAITDPRDLSPCTVIIECKGCWNKSLATAIPDQLVDRYLGSPRTAGILLVGYFDCSLWQAGTRPPCSPTHSKEAIEAHQVNLATQQGASVRAKVLDCRPGGPHGARPAAP